ncbi:hypothetical protein NCAS_0A01830 [Naumovozyma castellii]|uniref:Uncharacterized protein n=1 Tax=Naumovozyma castellii TaxID=27288 RepID=G0V5K4_NAUCA|nr:hypothetical protein NCAS_0A01830 [Naumovozyma castellii CBS 4309]CCC66741.1 hypothetical protein NCAS_0A01830 [Naumovozyma castellii CBS 4309]
MSAFNNFCVVCDKLIVSPSDEQETASTVSNESSDKLYCSDMCKLRDSSVSVSVSVPPVQNDLDSGREHDDLELKHVSEEQQDSDNLTTTLSTETINSTTTLEQSDSLITSPLLMPQTAVTRSTILKHPTYEELMVQDDFWLNMDSHLPRTLSDFYPTKALLNSSSNSVIDQTAENNYKIWLDYNH